MNRAHAERKSAPLDVLKLASRKAEIELLGASFVFLWPAHDRGSLAERMRPGV
jgi:hypothetical protein